MSRLQKLKETKSLSDIANMLGFKPKAVSYILFSIPNKDKYVNFEIPKKNGGKRLIKAPTDKLKLLQRRLADLLNECFDEIRYESGKKTLSHGFIKKHSIVTNAKNHKNKRYVFNVDLQNFFPSINFGRVRGFFIKNHHFNLDRNVATVIAQIACHDNELPQGSPCSPVISNLIGHLLDIRIVNLAKKYKCTYSRYVDDLTFSTNKRDFPNSIAIMNSDNSWDAGGKLIREIEKVGFSLNLQKTSMQFKTSRQIVTGPILFGTPFAKSYLQWLIISWLHCISICKVLEVGYRMLVLIFSRMLKGERLTKQFFLAEGSGFFRLVLFYSFEAFDMVFEIFISSKTKHVVL